MASLLDDIWTWVIRIVVAIVALAIAVPLVLTVVTSFSSSTLFPPRSWSLYGYERLPVSLVQGFFTSLLLGVVSVLFSMALSLPAALAIVRGRLPGSSLLQAIFTSPLQVPGIVIGLALYQYYVTLSRVASLPLRGQFVGLLGAHVLIVTPFVLNLMVSRLSAISPSIEEASYGLGAGWFRTTAQVTLPLMKPALVAGAVLGFLLSFNEVTASMFLTGSNMTTFPVEMLGMAQFEFNTVVYAAGALAVVASVGAAVAVERFIGLRSVLSL